LTPWLPAAAAAAAAAAAVRGFGMMFVLKHTLMTTATNCVSFLLMTTATNELNHRLAGTTATPAPAQHTKHCCCCLGVRCNKCFWHKSICSRALLLWHLTCLVLIGRTGPKAATEQTVLLRLLLLLLLYMLSVASAGCRIRPCQLERADVLVLV
jgi:hypothetical protein